MSENKVVWFLNDRVLAREIRASRYVKGRTTADGVPVRQTLGISAVKAYVAAIVDLWSFQKSKGLNPHPNPRGEALNGVLRARTRGEHRRRLLEFADRAAGTLQDGYDEAKMVDAVRFCWQDRQQKRQSIEPYLRTAADFLLAHNVLLRSESRLAAEFPDFSTIPLPGEGPTPCFPMIMIMDNGKMNPLGRLEYGAVMRHRNPLLCTMAHTAFYLFYRWNIAGETPPCFRQRQQWYGLHLIKGEHAARQMAYDTQLDWINRMFTGAGVTLLKKTHAGRSQGAKHAELKGVNEGQIRRVGRWNSDALTNCYLRKTLPAIAERLSVLHQSLARDVNDWGVQTKERLDNIETRLGDLFEGRVSMTLNASHRVAAPGGATPASMTTATAFHSIPTSPRGGEPLSPSAWPPPPPPPPPPSSSYVLSRTISTVPQLWREWTVGLGNGLSVQGLEDLYGPRWRPAHSEKVMYSRRKVIIDEIRRRQAEGINTGAAVEEVELMRQRGRLSLHQLHQLLNRQKRSAQQ